MAKWFVSRVRMLAEYGEVPNIMVMELDESNVSYIKTQVESVAAMTKDGKQGVESVHFGVPLIRWFGINPEPEDEEAWDALLAELDDSEWKVVKELPEAVGKALKANEDYHGVRGEELVVSCKRDGQLDSLWFEAYEKYGDVRFETGMVCANNLKEIIG